MSTGLGELHRPVLKQGMEFAPSAVRSACVALNDFEEEVVRREDRGGQVVVLARDSGLRIRRVVAMPNCKLSDFAQHPERRVFLGDHQDMLLHGRPGPAKPRTDSLKSRTNVLQCASRIGLPRFLTVFSDAPFQVGPALLEGVARESHHSPEHDPRSW